MSLFTTLLVILVTLLAATISGIYSVRVNKLELPNVVRNGTGPFTLSCSYEIADDEVDGLVVQWFHNKNELIHDRNELIYQWIPPMAPQDAGVISGLADYADKDLSNPRSLSVIQLRKVTIEMGGKYTCRVSTLQGEDTKSGTMTVYVPESSMEIRTMVYNETHISLTCVVKGAWPRPDFEYKVNGETIDGEMLRPNEPDNRNNRGFWSRYRAFIVEPEDPVLIVCEINIPLTDYRRRENVVYYPRSHRSNDNVTQINQ